MPKRTRWGESKYFDFIHAKVSVTAIQVFRTILEGSGAEIDINLARRHLEELQRVGLMQKEFDGSWLVTNLGMEAAKHYGWIDA